MAQKSQNETISLAKMVDNNSSAVPQEPFLEKMLSRPMQPPPNEHEDHKKSMDDASSSWRKMKNIRVIARFRPSNKVEKAEAKKSKIQNIPPKITKNQIIITVPKKGMMGSSSRKKEREQYVSTLDHVFKQEVGQKGVFKIVGEPLIYASLEGFNATLFAYGQTGSGKTYSMFGASSSVDKMGLIPRSFVFLFDKLNAKVEYQKIQTFAVSVQMLQIYNKQLLDLLNPNSKTPLQIKTNFDTNSVYVQHLRKIDVTSAREALAVLIEGSKNRIVSGHKLNAESSRSHMLVMLKIVQTRLDGSFISSSVNFGDLAGSENINKAHGDDNKKRGRRGRGRSKHNKNKQRAKLEAININASLSALTMTIKYLSEGKNPGYRDSPLTYVLKDSLGGNSKTTLLVCVSPHIFNREETKRTLVFASTAKKVENKAKINETLSVAQLLKRIEKLKAENTRLKAENTILNGKLKNLKGRGRISMVDINVTDAVSPPGNEPKLYKQYTNQSKSNKALVYTHNLTADTFIGRERGYSDHRDSGRDRRKSSIISITNSNDEEIALAGALSPLQNAISVSNQEMAKEADEYMEKIESLKNELLQQVDVNNQEIEKNNQMRIELDKSDTTIHHLRNENNQKAVEIFKKDEEIEDLQKKMAEIKFTLNAYKKKYPNTIIKKPRSSDINKYLPPDLRKLATENSDISDASDDDGQSLQLPPNQLTSIMLPGRQQSTSSLGQSMDLQQVEMLNEYLKDYQNINSTLLEEIRKSQNMNSPLPEIQEIQEKTDKYFKGFDQKTKELKSQISSIKFILEHFIEQQKEAHKATRSLIQSQFFDNNDKNHSNQTLINHQSEPSPQYSTNTNDENRNYENDGNIKQQSVADISDDENNYNRMEPEEIARDIQQSSNSCWSIFYCNKKEEENQSNELDVVDNNYQNTNY